MRLHDAHVTIIGLGLMGGSLARALHNQCKTLIGVDHDRETIDLAKRLGVVDHAIDDPVTGLGDCDLAILALPVQAIIDTLAKLGDELPSPRFILDLGSTKTEVVRAMETLPTSMDPLGGHPLCGKETSGFSAGESTLFRGHPFVLSPLDRTSDDMKQLAIEIVEAVGAHPVIMEAGRHDRLIAATSHLPYLFAAALMAIAIDRSDADDALWDIVASGFRDTSRLAGSDVTMMTDILLTNCKEVDAVLDQALEVLQNWKNLVASKDLERLRAELSPIQRQGSQLISRQSQLKDSYEL